MHILRAGKKAILKTLLVHCSIRQAILVYTKSVCYEEYRGIRAIVRRLTAPFFGGQQSKVCIFLQFQRGILSVSAIKVCCGRDLYYMDHGFLIRPIKKFKPHIYCWYRLCCIISINVPILHGVIFQ